MSAANNLTVHIKIDFNNEINGYILDISNSELNTQLISSVLDFVILNYRTFNIRYVNISHNNFEFKSENGLKLLDKILYCYRILHIGIDASYGLQHFDDNIPNYIFTENEKVLLNNNGVII